MNNNNRLLLIILDGWGLGKKDKSDAIFNADTPFFDSLMANEPNSKLLTCGENVGLPDGQMGNSEVGHLNIGAGRKVYNGLASINRSIATGEINKNEALIDAFTYARDQKKKLHFIGLVSDGGVHSLDRHLYKLCKMADDYGLQNVFIHAITDGRDTDPQSGVGFIKSLIENTKNTSAKIATLIGRYYSMDRDKRWERIKQGYDLMVHGVGEKTEHLLESIQNSYDKGVTDEFIGPIVMVDQDKKPLATIEDGDAIICFNFRSDRLRQMTIALSQEDFPEFSMKAMNLQYYTMSNYDKNLKNIRVIYNKKDVVQTLGEVLAQNGKKQLRIAETEKYAHVTYFFSGGREELFGNEDRILVPSPKVATYDLKPEMSAPEIAEKITVALNTNKYDFICLNYANGDMVGHTGVYDAILKAAATVDKCLQKTVNAALENNYHVIVTADHGNADHALNDDQTPNTAHSLNPVPCILLGVPGVKLKNGVLADLAPTILKIIGLDQPDEMTGTSLF